MTATRKPHPAETAERERAARCSEFWSFHFAGRGQKAGARFGILAEAADDARRLEAEAKARGNVRGAMVYGFTPDRTKVHIPRADWPAAQEGTTMDERFEKLSVSQLVTCIEAVEGERPGKPSSKAAGLKRLARGMAERSLDADEVLNAAGDVIGAMEAAILAAGPDADPMETLAAAEAARLDAERQIEAATTAPYNLVGRDAGVFVAMCPEKNVVLGAGMSAAEAIAEADSCEPAKAALAPAEDSPRRLPKEGSKERTAYEMMTRPGGATNQELVAATGLRYSFAANGRRFAARYGLAFAASREGRTVRFQLHATA